MGDFLLASDEDIDTSNGIFSLTSDIGQKIKIHLNSFYGEWFLDSTYGVPYFQSIFARKLTKSNIDSIFKNQILSVNGVKEILSYSSTLQNRIYSYTANIRYEDGSTSTIGGEF